MVIWEWPASSPIDTKNVRFRNTIILLLLRLHLADIISHFGVAMENRVDGMFHLEQQRLTICSLAICRRCVPATLTMITYSISKHICSAFAIGV